MIVLTRGSVGCGVDRLTARHSVNLALAIPLPFDSRGGTLDARVRGQDI